MSARARLKGLFLRATDAVAQGTRSMEEVHRTTAARPFAVLARMPPPIAVPARGVKLVHDVVATAAYGSVRIVNQGVAAVVDAGFDLAAAVTGAPPEETRTP